MATAVELEPAAPEVKRYQRHKIALALTSATLSLVWLGALAFVFGSELGATYSAWFGDRPWQRLLASAAVVAGSTELLTVPFAFVSGYVLEHRYQLSNQTLAGWLWHRVKAYLVGGVLGAVLVAGLYLFLWTTGRWWWLWATAGWLGATLVLGQLLPVVILPLFYRVTRLNDASLLDRFRKLTEGTTLTIEGVYELRLSDETKKANAALAGLGRTRRVLLGDTLLAQFTPAEIAVVFAHEVGHHVYRHLPKMIGLGTVLTLLGFGLADALLNAFAVRLGYAGFDDPAALPLFLFVMALFALAWAPVRNAISRRHERQCDRYALERTRDPESYRSAFIKLAKLNKSDPDPHPLIALFFYDHPPIRERLALASKPEA